MRLLPAVLASAVHLASAHPTYGQLILQALHPAFEMAPLTTSTISAQTATSLLVSDVLDRERSINIFSGFTRDVDSPSVALDSASRNVTVLAPENSAIQKLPHKPWEDPQEYGALGKDAYKGEDGTQRASRNLRMFVEAHIVTQSPWKPGQKAKTARGDEVWIEEKDDKWIIMPSKVEVSRITDQVKNGEVWVLSKCLNYSH